ETERRTHVGPDAFTRCTGSRREDWKGVSKAQELRDAVNAALGKDTVRLASDPRYVTKYVSTGLLPFDILMQGGIPKGRMCMISGDYSTLKSYVGLKSI